MIDEKYYESPPITSGKVLVYGNDLAVSLAVIDALKEKLRLHGFQPVSDLTEDASLIIVVGGDGTLLSALHDMGFPETPIVGINTGHLGFFQELVPDQMDEFLFRLKKGEYRVQPMRTVNAKVTSERGVEFLTGLNEVLIKSAESRIVHMNISIGDNFIERFSGDGLLAATPAGSTAYNYALGGSIVDPRLELLQLTPMAPMNTAAYRSFTSSILLPAGLAVRVEPESGSHVVMAVDGREQHYEELREVRMEFSPSIIRLLRMDDYDFWSKVKSKLL